MTTFAIPSGMLLVITAAGIDVEFFIYNSSPSTLHGQATVTNAGNLAAGSEHFSTGLAVSTMPTLGIVSGTGSVTAESFAVQGYLVSP